METLTKMAIEGFISVIRFVIAGIDSYGICEQNEWVIDPETVARCADCIDCLATYYYLNRSRSIPTMGRLNAIVQANNTLWNDLFEKILRCAVEAYSFYLSCGSKCSWTLLCCGCFDADPWSHRKTERIDDQIDIQHGPHIRTGDSRSILPEVPDI